MKPTHKTYALLAAVGKYDDGALQDLPGASGDLQLMRNALTDGLKVESDNIRALGLEGADPDNIHAPGLEGADPDNVRALGLDGIVTGRSFARALAEFQALLSEEDTFILYFSGHGAEQQLVFSDGGITLDSIIAYVEKLPARQKIVMLDCCYSGQAQTTAWMSNPGDGSLARMAGSGIAVIASSAADEVSWTSENGRTSQFTNLLASALHTRRLIREGRISLTDIMDEVRYLVDCWNLAHPDKKQRPVFRESMLGTIFFKVEEYHPYVPQQLYMETDDFIIHHVKPLNTMNQKRLAVFVILKGEDDSIVPEMTRKIIPYVRYSDVYASERSAERFQGKPVDVVWCYFGHDETDLTRGNHFAYSIWTEDEKLKDVYYKPGRNSEMIGDIFVSWNTSYHIVKEIQESDTPEERILSDYRMLSNRIIKGAETFIRDLEEAENQKISLSTLKAAHLDWIREIRNLYFHLTDADVVPVRYHQWAEAVLEMAGWIVDAALWLEKEAPEGEGNEWLLRESIRRYYQALENLKAEEEKKESMKKDLGEFEDMDFGKNM